MKTLKPEVGDLWNYLNRKIIIRNTDDESIVGSCVMAAYNYYYDEDYGPCIQVHFKDTAGSSVVRLTEFTIEVVV